MQFGITDSFLDEANNLLSQSYNKYRNDCRQTLGNPKTWTVLILDDTNKD